LSEQAKDYYAALDLESDATEKEIHKAFRKLSKTYHPDISKEKNAEEIFKRIREAYEVLSDPEEREQYDQFIKMEKEGKNRTFESVFSQFHSNAIGAHTPVPGDDVEMKATFFVSEVRQGLEKEVRFEQYVNCQDCEGHGYLRDIASVCLDCRGNGFRCMDVKTPFGDIVTEKVCVCCEGKGYVNVTTCESCGEKGKASSPIRLRFKLPKETTEGFRLVLKGKGDAGLNGGRSGNLILHFTQNEDDPLNIIHDYDVRMRLDVPFLKSLTGGSVKVKMPSGETIKIPIARGTQTGHHIIIPNEGLFNPVNGFYGNLTAVVNILTPTGLSDEKVVKILNLLSQEEKI
jgi:molecular chaperone DnaJ